eukprot:CAMPEP_0195061354 /NCGR_PEP_ID=MMETSP0448-20130528/8317_1 /TAXON_ID=66468 /ORGANISM="Heterocapsa triquestra, Strain CCMP 448" /LENGTH=657 /DNA_ID=CAMNT_0040091907 /DNA_START=30 /DNA_END=2000 /DNA_ORIENTATION=+
MSAPPPPPKGGTPPAASSSAGDSGMRRRPVPVHYDWYVDNSQEDAEGDDEDAVFEDEQQSKFQEYFGIFCDYIFWILLAYCASNVLLWLGERFGLISPQFEEWMPVRWWHTNPHGLQKELFDNATSGAVTVAQFEGLKKWIEGGPGGWVSPKLAVTDYLSERGRYERRLELKDPVDKDEVLVKLPLSHVLSSDFCQQDLTDSTIRQVVEAQKKSTEPMEISPWTWITLYMIAHSRKGTSGSHVGSSWRFDSLIQKEYIDASLSYLPIFWDDDNLHWLNGTDLLNVHVLDVHAAIETEYHKLTYLVPAIESGIPVIEFKKWAMVVMSRGETVDLPDRENKTRTVPQLAIMPLIDLVDHHLPMPDKPLFLDDLQQFQESGSHTNISYNAELAAVVLRAREGLTSKTAVTVGYGVRSNADYLLYHGFTMPREWSDLTLCTQYAMIELPLPENSPSWKTPFLVHPYRFAVPACPNKKSTPHVIVGAARFLLATEEDVVGYEARKLKEQGKVKKGEFMQQGTKEALGIACDLHAQPPVCKEPLSLENERAAWEYIKTQTLARVQQHVGSIHEDESALQEDDKRGTLTVNQRHAVIVRREEKVTLRRWCAVASRTVALLATPQAGQACEVTRVPDSETLENEEPRTRPAYWARLLEPLTDADA